MAALLKGIFVNSTRAIDYAGAIVNGYKTIETRSRNTLKQLVNNPDPIAIIRTGRGKAQVIGYAYIDGVFHCSKADFGKYDNMHLVPHGSRYDAGQHGKYMYMLSGAEPCKPFELPDNAVRHGFSWCEYMDPNFTAWKAV